MQQNLDSIIIGGNLYPKKKKNHQTDIDENLSLSAKEFVNVFTKQLVTWLSRILVMLQIDSTWMQ